MHTIRLHGPWELHQSGEEPKRVKLPNDWQVVVGQADDQELQIKRWFNRPTGLTSTSSVSLSFENLPIAGTVFLDETLLGELNPIVTEFPIADDILPSRACITIRVASSAESPPTRPSPQIALKIVDPR